MLSPKSEGDMLQVAGGGWSSPVYGVETAQMRRGCRTELCLETQLCGAAALSWGEWEGKALSMPTRADQCFTFALHRMRRLVLPMWSVWALVLLLECVFIWDRCLVQGALRSLICLSTSRTLLVSGKKCALQGFPAVMPFCAAANVELCLKDTRICVPQYLSEKHRYFLSCLDLCQWKGMPVS